MDHKTSASWIEMVRPSNVPDCNGVSVFKYVTFLCGHVEIL